MTSSDDGSAARRVRAPWPRCGIGCVTHSYAMSDQRWAKQAASALFGVARARRSETRAEIEAYSDRDDASDDGLRSHPVSPGRRDPTRSSHGLRPGDVVAFLQDGLPYVLDRSATGDAIPFGLSALEDAVSVADPATHLVVVRQGNFMGFKSETLGEGKLLQARHRGRARLCFFNKNHGVNEQWETFDEPVGDDWTTCSMRLRNRRLPSCVLKVQVTKIPPEMSGRSDRVHSSPHNDSLARDADQGSSDNETDDEGITKKYKDKKKPHAARRVAFSSDELPQKAASHSIPTPSTAGTCNGYKSQVSQSPGNSEQPHALRSMSGVLIKEWSAFVLKEVKARKEVEAQMLDLRNEMRGMFSGFKNEVNLTRQEWIGDASFYGANVRNTREASRLQRIKIVKMARRTFFSRWTSSSFAKWRHNARTGRRARFAMQLMVSRLKNMRLASALSAWRERTRARCVARRAISRSVMVGNKNALRRAFNSWKRSTLVDRDTKRHDKLVGILQKKAVQKMRSIVANRAFGGWKDGYTERKRLRRVLTKITQRWMRLQSTDAFYRWHTVSSGKKRRRDRLSKLVLRVLGREQHAVFVGWAKHTKKSRRDRHVLAVLSTKFQRGALRTSFTFWCNESTANASRKKRVKALTKRIVTRWNMASQAKAFERWRVMAVRKHEQRNKALAIAKKWRRRDLHAAFAEWAMCVMYRLAARDNAMLFAVRLVRLSTHKAFRTWRDTTRDFVMRRQKMRAVVERWRTMEMQCAFEGWRTTVQTLITQGKRARVLVWRITHRSVDKAFRQWSQSVARAAREMSVKTQVLLPLLQRKLAAAFKGWRFRVEDLKRRTVVARKVVYKMQRLRAYSAFATWVERTGGAVEGREVIRKVLLKMQRVKVHSAFVSWVDFVTDAHTEKVKITRAAKFAFRRASDRAEHIWSLWFAETRKLVSFRRRAARAVSRIRMSVVSRAFAKWNETFEEKKRFDNLLAKGRTKFNRFTLRKVMKAWWVDAEDRIRLRRVTDRACRKLDTLKLRHFFREWRDASAEDLGTKAKIRRASKLWGKQVLASAWRSWKSSVNLDRVKQSNARVHFAIKQAVRQERSRRSAWLGWIEYVGHYKRMSNLVAKAYKKSRQIYTQSVFDSWCDFVSEVEQRKETLKRCVTSKRLLTAWFLDWYWQAFEGDISGALGLISESTENVISGVYGNEGGVDTNVFKQWRQLGSSLEAMTAGADPRSPVREAARVWRERTNKAESEFLSPTLGGVGVVGLEQRRELDERLQNTALVESFSTPPSGSRAPYESNDSSGYDWDEKEEFQSAGPGTRSNRSTPGRDAKSPVGGRGSPLASPSRLGRSLRFRVGSSDNDDFGSAMKSGQKKKAVEAYGESSSDDERLFKCSPGFRRRASPTSTDASSPRWANAARRMSDDMEDVA